MYPRIRRKAPGRHGRTFLWPGQVRPAQSYGESPNKLHRKGTGAVVLNHAGPVRHGFLALFCSVLGKHEWQLEQAVGLDATAPKMTVSRHLCSDIRLGVAVSNTVSKCNIITSSFNHCQDHCEMMSLILETVAHNNINSPPNRYSIFRPWKTPGAGC